MKLPELENLDICLTQLCSIFIINVLLSSSGESQIVQAIKAYESLMANNSRGDNPLCQRAFYFLVCAVELVGILSPVIG